MRKKLFMENNACTNSFGQWIEGIPYELAFWNNVYRWKGTYDGLFKWSHYGSAIDLEGFDANSFLSKYDHPTVLDVGCGMSYATGNFINTSMGLMPLDIHYVDPLANYFNKIANKHKRDLPKIEYGMMEYLSAFYPKNSAQLIIIQNALDHSSNPLKGIIESLKVLPIGGKLYLNHHPNEAEMEHYKGFHQFNVDIKDDKLIIWNKTSKIVVNNLLDGMAALKSFHYDNGHIISIITKIGEVRNDLYDYNIDRRILCNNIDDIVASQFSIRKMLLYKLNYLKFNLIQFCVQALPWNIKMGLKKLIHQA